MAIGRGLTNDPPIVVEYGVQQHMMGGRCIVVERHCSFDDMVGTVTTDAVRDGFRYEIRRHARCPFKNISWVVPDFTRQFGETVGESRAAVGRRHSTQDIYKCDLGASRPSG